MVLKTQPCTCILDLNFSRGLSFFIVCNKLDIWGSKALDFLVYWPINFVWIFWRPKFSPWLDQICNLVQSVHQEETHVNFEASLGVFNNFSCFKRTLQHLLCLLISLQAHSLPLCFCNKSQQKHTISLPCLSRKISQISTQSLKISVSIHLAVISCLEHLPKARKLGCWVDRAHLFGTRIQSLFHFWIGCQSDFNKQRLEFVLITTIHEKGFIMALRKSDN